MLIGISGARRSGKTTLANAIAASHGMMVTSFAEPMRLFVASILGVSLNELEQIKEEPIEWLDGLTPRHLLRSVGTEWGRLMIHKEIWIRSALRRSVGHCVFSDVRIPNEASAIRDDGGTIIRVHRSVELSGVEHSSDVPLPSELVDYEISNDGAPEDMLAAASRVLFPQSPRHNPALDPDIANLMPEGAPSSAYVE